MSSFKNSKVVATFISIQTEISMELINNYLICTDKTICLPVITNNYDYLIFRNFDKNTNFVKGKFGVLEPDNNSLSILPDFVLTPCLAFDELGNRMGYGGGYYDKTFARFKKDNHNFISVAVAYDEQKINNVVNSNNDQKIDYILTEKQIYRTL